MHIVSNTFPAFALPYKMDNAIVLIPAAAAAAAALFLMRPRRPQRPSDHWVVHFPQVYVPHRGYTMGIEDCWKEVAHARGYAITDNPDEAHYVISKVAERNFSCDTVRYQQLYNHICDQKNLGNKRLLHQLLATTSVNVPLTFDLTTEEGTQEFLRECAENPDAIWVIKQSTMDNGRGVAMIPASAAEEALQMRGKDNVKFDLACAFIHPPLLVHKRKCDFRVFVLVASVDPLVVYLYRDFMTRLSSFKYDLENMDSLFTINTEENGADEAMWSKHQLSPKRLDRALKHPGFAETVVRAQLRPMLREIFEKAAGSGAITHTAGGYTLLGIDVMLDADHKLWLIEINTSPQMSKGSASEWKRQLNTNICHDTYALLEDMWAQIAERGNVYDVPRLDEVAISANTLYERIV